MRTATVKLKVAILIQQGVRQQSKHIQTIERKRNNKRLYDAILLRNISFIEKYIAQKNDLKKYQLRSIYV